MADLRKPIAGLVAGAALLAALVGFEGQTTKAVIPVPGDVPTICNGTTRYPDGRPVKLGDTATPEQCESWLRINVSKFEGAIKKCVKVPLAQYEYDAYVSLAYNIGTHAFCGSSIPKKLNRKDYQAACETILEFDCGPATEATRANPGGKCYRTDKPLRQIKGLTKRRFHEYKMCIGER
ncbi:MAG: lysozyme [Rhodocyclaceae bacterium]|nr:lysozyme [Rhodocyclaceae bacterium]